MSQLIENKRARFSLIANEPMVFAESYGTAQNRMDSLGVIPPAPKKSGSAEGDLLLVFKRVKASPCPLCSLWRKAALANANREYRLLELIPTD